MKLLPVLLGLAVLAGCSQGGAGPQLLNSQSFQPSTNDTVENDSDLFSNFRNQQSVQKLIYHVGPVNLEAHQQAEVMLEQPKVLQFQVNEPLWLVGFKPQVIDANGNNLSGQLLYKAILLNKNEANPVCPSGNNGNPFAVATAALTKISLPEGFGYPLLPNDPLEAKVIFQNESDQDYLDVSFSFEIEAIPMEKASAYSDVKAMLLDTDPCEFKPIAIEPGALMEKNKTFSLSENGNLLVANGVLSNYGVSVSLTHQKSNELSVVPFWRAEAKLNEEHALVDLTPNPFIDMEGKSIQKGDKITLGVVFDNFSDSWNFEATGGAMLYLAPNS